MINEKIYAKFVDKVRKTYKKKVSYHNELHGIDVA